jgi:hypothetical protein
MALVEPKAFFELRKMKDTNADEILTAFMELERAIHEFAVSLLF